MTITEEDFRKARHSFFRLRLFWLILIGLIAVRACLIVSALNLAGDDGERYFQESVNLVHLRVFSFGTGLHPLPSAHDLPLFPALMALLLAAFQSEPVTQHAVALLNCLFYACAAVLASLMALRITASRNVALLTLFVMAVAPESIPYSVFFMPDSMFLALLLSFAYLALDYRQTGKLRSILLAFLVAGVAILVKPVALFYGLVLSLVVLVTEWRGRRRVGFALLVCLAGLILQAALVSPWIVRNSRVFRISGLTSITGTNLFYYNYRLMLEDWQGREKSEMLLRSGLKRIRNEHPEAASNPMIQAKLLKVIAAKGLSEHPFRYLITTIKHHPRLYFGTGTVAMFHAITGDDLLIDRPQIWQRWWFLTVQGVSWGALVLIYGLSAAGILRMWMTRNWLALAAVVVNLMYFAALVGPVTSTRYRMPMLPFFAIAAGIGANWMLEAISRREFLSSSTATA